MNEKELQKLSYGFNNDQFYLVQNQKGELISTLYDGQITLLCFTKLGYAMDYCKRNDGLHTLQIDNNKFINFVSNFGKKHYINNTIFDVLTANMVLISNGNIFKYYLDIMKDKVKELDDYLDVKDNDEDYLAKIEMKLFKLPLFVVYKEDAPFVDPFIIDDIKENVLYCYTSLDSINKAMPFINEIEAHTKQLINFNELVDIINSDTSISSIWFNFKAPERAFKFSRIKLMKDYDFFCH